MNFSYKTGQLVTKVGQEAASKIVDERSNEKNSTMLYKTLKKDSLARRALALSNWVMVIVVVFILFRSMFVEVIGTPTEVAIRTFLTLITGWVSFYIFFLIYLYLHPNAYPPKGDTEHKND